MDASSVACYHRDLEPYMARGRELAAQKVTGQKRNDILWKEVAEGKLSLPREPRTLYVLTGTSFDVGSGKVTDAYLRWVIYLPFATPESTGLSTKPSDNAPWLMYPGTAGAHIMIKPPHKKKARPAARVCAERTIPRPNPHRCASSCVQQASRRSFAACSPLEPRAGLPSVPMSKIVYFLGHGFSPEAAPK